MISLKHLACAAVLALGSATTAHAVSAPSPGVTFTDNVNDSFDVIFQTVPGTVQQTAFFNIGFDFNLSVDWEANGNNFIGFAVDDETQRLSLAPSSTTCAGTSGPEACDELFGSTVEPLVLGGDFEAGSFNLSVFATNFGATTSTLTFSINKVAPVPLPAGGLLLIGALGGFAMVRRRKS